MIIVNFQFRWVFHCKGKKATSHRRCIISNNNEHSREKASAAKKPLSVFISNKRSFQCIMAVKAFLRFLNLIYAIDDETLLRLLLSHSKSPMASIEINEWKSLSRKGRKNENDAFDVSINRFRLLASFFRLKFAIWEKQKRGAKNRLRCGETLEIS